MAAKRGGPNRPVAVDYTNHPDTVIVNPDLSDLTLGQEEEIEELIGDSLWGTLGNEEKLQAKVKRAIAYVVRKAEDPSFTWEDSARLRLLMILPVKEEEGEEKDPVPPTNGRGSSTRSRSANTSRSSRGTTSKP